MGVFLYQPGVQVYIDTEKNGILDVSADLVSGNMVRRSNGVSSFTFALQNVRRKYDQVFTPNDRIIVNMKRVTWLRVFTGYLNSVPLVTAWPQDIQLTASCSLKRLQYYFWDPMLEASQSLVSTAMSSAKNPDDGGTANAVLTVLSQVVGWPPDKVHIAGIPATWTKFAYKIAKAVAAEAAEADQLAQQFYTAIGANGSVGGQSGGTVPSGALKAGTYGGVAIDKSQADLACVVYNTCMQMGGSSRDAAIGIMTAMTESSLVNSSVATNADSVGIFQQRPSQGWGTVAQCSDPTYASQQFYKHLFKISNRDSMSEPMAAQSVQASAFADGSNYQKFQAFGDQVAAALGKAGPGSLASSPAFQQLTKSSGTGHATGQQLATTGLNLVKTYPHIMYQFGNDNSPSTPASQLNALDCSSFVQWCYYNTLGSMGPGSGIPRTSQEQSKWCQNITPAQGMNIPGALMFIGGLGTAHHVEISVGDGQHTVGTRQTGTPASEVQSKGWFDVSGLAPGVDYSGTPGTSPGAGAGTGSASTLQVTTESTQPWYNKTDRFDKLFGTGPWYPQFDASAAAEAELFTGPRALLPDTPLLPYIGNMVNATLRSYSSAPNGDFIAWFPDYYGMWGTAAVMTIQPVELQDFSVYWDDTYLVTHQFTVAPLGHVRFELVPATLANVGPLQAFSTVGIASIDIPGIMYALFGLEPTKAEAQKFIDYMHQRFGVRVDFEQLPGVTGYSGEFFSALYLFQQNWAYQYNADVSLTFMPELWPGMLIQIPEFAFQAYVTTVTHAFQFGPGGYFTTTVNIAAPARMPSNTSDSGSTLIGLPLAGGLTGTNVLPGTGGR